VCVVPRDILVDDGAHVGLAPLGALTQPTRLEARLGQPRHHEQDPAQDAKLQAD